MFRLALQLGSTVQELSRRMSYRELRLWMQYYTLEPWGLEVQDFFHADWQQQFVNMHRDTTKRKKPYALKEFLLFSGEKPKMQSKKPSAPKPTKAAKPVVTSDGAVLKRGGTHVSDETLTFLFLHAVPAKGKKPQ